MATRNSAIVVVAVLDNVVHFPRSIDDFLQAAYDSEGDDSVLGLGSRGQATGDATTTTTTTSTTTTTTTTTTMATPPWWCARIGAPLSRLFLIRRHRRYARSVVSLGLSCASDASELFSIGYVLGDASFQRDILRNDLSGLGALITGMTTLGLILGGLLSICIERRCGRKSMLLAGLSISTSFGLACASSLVSRGATSFALCRLSTGIGAGMVLASQPALSTEISPPRERGLIVSVANGLWTAGTIFNALCALVIFGIRGGSWRTYLAVSTVPGIASLLLVWCYVPDSPRYRALHGDYVGAARCANSAARSMGYLGVPLTAEEVEAHYRIDCDGDGDDRGDNDGDNVDRSILSRQRRTQYRRYDDDDDDNDTLTRSIRRALNNVRLIYARQLLKPTIIMQILWISASIGAALAYWINTLFQNLHLSNVYASFVLLNCAAIPGNIASALLTDRIGRNAFFASSMMLAGMSLFAVSAIVVSSSSSSSSMKQGDINDDASTQTIPIVLCTCVFYASLSAVYTVIYVMASELFPTSVRSTGLAVCATFGRIASFGATFVNGALINRPTILLSVGASVLFVGGTLAWMCPPTEMKLKPVLDEAFSTLDEIVVDHCEVKMESSRKRKTRVGIRGVDLAMTEYRSIT